MQYILLLYIASVAGCYFGYSWVYKHYREVMERDLGPTDPEILFRIASFIPIMNTIITVLIIYGMAVHYLTPGEEEEKKDPNKITKDDLRP